MKHLPDPVLEKAIEIANALLEEGMDEGKAIRIAIAKAKEWAGRHGIGISAKPHTGSIPPCQAALPQCLPPLLAYLPIRVASPTI